MLQIFADAPSIPELQGILFSGCKGPNGEAPFAPNRGRAHGAPGGPQEPQVASGRAPSAYFKLFEKVYNAGYNPNVRIMPERFRKTFSTRKEAYAWVCSLKPELSRGNGSRVASNADPFITDTSSGVEFCIATSAVIIWWDVSKSLYHPA